MTNIEIQSQQEFTEDGRVGTLMFVGGPIVGGLGYAWLLNELARSYPQLFLPLCVVALGAFVFLIGCVKMLVGRTYRHNVVVQSDRSA
ncbi:hypothetical protein ACFX5Q_33920 [Mesorhizobium sp. IMUNJ 23033]|uniref:hypothetical protein n=1 Tax=Mesorhizobium sp. IMUNJ 23033 TaxID=3378039 RepID=UPI00384B5D9E